MRATIGCLLLAILLAPGCETGGDNGFPSMEPIGDRGVYVGETLVVTVRAEDPDGDGLSFYIQGRPEGATFSQTADTATLTWSPSITDAEEGGKPYPVTITVQDNQGAWVSQDFEIRVYPQGGVPVFLNPPGYILNLAETDYIAFRIEVKDDDTTDEDLTIRLDRPIPGALFRRDTGKSAVFYWEPTPEQIETRSYYSLLLAAKDEVHDEVLFEISIVLLHPEAAYECPGQPPTLHHRPLGDQSSSSGYRVTLEAFDAESSVRFPTAFWAEGLAPDPTAFRPVAMLNVADQPGVFEGFLPAVSPAGGAGFVTYYFLASDDDDVAADRCDHVVRLPKEGGYLFAAYGPSMPAGTCLQDDLEPNQNADGAVTLDDGVHAGLRLCPGDQDWFAVALGPGVHATFTLRHEATHGDVTFAVTDESGARVGDVSAFGGSTVVSVRAVDWERRLFAAVEAGKDAALTYSLGVKLSQVPCDEDDLEPDDGPADATSVVSSSRSFSGRTVCGVGADWYALAATAGQRLTAILDASPLDADLDLAVIGADGETVVAKVERTGVSREEISLNLLHSGTYYVRVYNQEGGKGVYTISLLVEDQAVSCQDDALSPNHEIGAAFLLNAGDRDLTLCPGKSDYFRTTLNGGETLEVQALADLAAGELRVTVWDGTGSTVWQSAELAADGYLSMEVLVPHAGDAVIQVEGRAATAVDYTLAFAARDPDGPCREDRLSPSHRRDEARLIATGFTTRLKVCNGAPDWFRVELPADVFAAVALYHDRGQGDLVLNVYQREETVPASESEWFSTERGQLIDLLTDLVGGTYYIEISVPGGVGDRTYDLSVDVIE